MCCSHVVLTKAVTDSSQVKLPYDQAIKADLAQLYDVVLFHKKGGTKCAAVIICTLWLKLEAGHSFARCVMKVAVFMCC